MHGEKLCSVTQINDEKHGEFETENTTCKPKNYAIKQFVEDSVKETPMYQPSILRSEAKKKFKSAIIPPLYQFQTWKSQYNINLRMGRSDYQMIDDLFSQHPNFISIYRENSEFVVVFKSNQNCFSQFCSKVGHINGVVGLDAQYKQNSEYFPLYILCSQNEHFNTVPGYVFMATSNSTKLVSTALLIIKTHLQDIGVIFNAYLMIDKCEIEQQAAEQNKIQIILCEFHTIKLIKTMWNKYIKDDHLQNELIILLKDIARSQNEIERSINIFSFKIYCSQRNLFEFYDYMQKQWFSECWIDSWTDLNRPGNREGLYNTNNASESFFRSLLHRYCHNKKHAPHVVIEIILHHVFPDVEEKIQLKKIQ